MSGKYAFTKTLKELRFLHCQTSEHSNAVRYESTIFLSLFKCAARLLVPEQMLILSVQKVISHTRLPDHEKEQPYIPIMIREARDTSPRVYARYEFGREKMEDLRGMWSLHGR